jgi:hypothetical protein
MIIDIGKHIRCVFKNGTVIEGIVKEWVIGSVQLQSLNDESIMIILHPEEDIMLIKVLADEPEEPAEEEKDAPPLKEEIVAKLEEIRTEEDTDLQGKSIAELKQLVKAQERQIIANKIKEHYPSAHAPHKPNYGSQVEFLPRGRGRR